MSEDLRTRVRRLAAESTDGTSWFETLYAAASGDAAQIPWGDRGANPNLVSWLERERPSARRTDGQSRRALVVGCGLGDDAELLSRCDFDVTAFDISSTAIDWCRRRFPQTRVTYAAVDLFHLPAEWGSAWDWVFEAYTVQALPTAIRRAALEAVARLVAPGGELLFVCRGRDAAESMEGPPWPLTKDDLTALVESGLAMRQFEDYLDAESPPVRRFRALFAR